MMTIQKMSHDDLNRTLECAEELLAVIPNMEFTAGLEIFVGELWDEVNRRENLEQHEHPTD